MIAHDLIGFTSLVTDTCKRSHYQAKVVEFQRPVKRRNDLACANPATIGIDQGLVRGMPILSPAPSAPR